MERIGAIVLAAGLSTRMGAPKVLMPWGSGSIVRHIVATLVKSSIDPILVVTGGVFQEVERELNGEKACQVVYNPHYQNGEMIVSLKTGLRLLAKDVHAILIVLGDQPQIETTVIIQIAEAYRRNKYKIIIPSYQMKRGHPWLLSKDLFEDMLSTPDTLKLNEFHKDYINDIFHLPVDSACILQDLDTPEDYKKYRPK